MCGGGGWGVGMGGWGVRRGLNICTCGIQKQGEEPSVIDLSPETDSSDRLDKRSKQHHVSSISRFELHSPKALHRCIRKQHGSTCFVCTTVVLRQPVGLSKEFFCFFYAGANWLKLICQTDDGERSFSASVLLVPKRC